jgi:hypothetical protein
MIRCGLCGSGPAAGWFHSDSGLLDSLHGPDTPEIGPTHSGTALFFVNEIEDVFVNSVPGNMQLFATID